ncbi:MAG: hydrogenase formation protein HypD [Caldimicrobium sp.]|nr:hydrogenase formation protein HypD [Caldimicrobium sp.]MCX7613698.1 hydrogenase formation protein HypD [Caldimicrobium sp.]MDW8183150.1 hydrogenase formation protein HypD [Caldimicrobium sp.]
MKEIFKLVRSTSLIQEIIKSIKAKLRKREKPLKIMEFCGGHTHSLLRFGLDELLHPEIEFLHGPGCPVCVLDESLLNYALELAWQRGIIFTTYGDLLRVPNLKGKSLLSLRAEGSDIRILSNAMEAFHLAKNLPQKKIIFFAIGFETTAPATAFVIKRAYEDGLDNLLVVSNHLLSIEVLDFLLSLDATPWMDGIIGPGHVSAIMGSNSFSEIARKYRIPIVISGFEPLDLVYAVDRLVDAVLRNDCEVINAYTRVVSPDGNLQAKGLLEEIFTVRDFFPWRGLGIVPRSAFAIKENFSFLDAERFFPKPIVEESHKGCICGRILQAKAKPRDCSLFAKACTPNTPIGPCMVSSEGACLAYFKYKKHD